MPSNAGNKQHQGDEHSFIDESWMQRGLDAMRESLDVTPALKKQMVEFLFITGMWDADKLSWDAAVARFGNCLNPARVDVHFKVAEIWALTKRFERYALFFAMCDDLGFERPRRIPTEERRLQLLERMTKAAEAFNLEFAYLSGEAGRLGQTGPAFRVHPGIKDGGVFSMPAEPTAVTEAMNAALEIAEIMTGERQSF